MRTLGRIAYWLAAIVLLAAILMSLDYTLVQAVLLGLVFCPCSLALEYLMPKARKPMDKIYLSLAVVVAVILLIVVLHYSVLATIIDGGMWHRGKEVSPMLINPAFLGLILTALSFGDYAWTRWLDKRYKSKDRNITFFSDRKSVTLNMADIAYIESNDTEVRIITVTGESYRNKTGISQWENLLGEDFLRIHRSYLVNINHISSADTDAVSVGSASLPVSRKYREAVSLVLKTTE